ncbi:hypothetical protein Ocin01_15481 [Orchesella cincta]|uniref:Uncharacterized protein n=1 Tax=Orchesella cincta TaxID=48709 RepID=A0A1D2MEC8_ORCCI|nr:hypothetical protein Ocin01_15481 [Orchesella cincta]
MGDDSASSTDDEAILINELARGYKKYRDVPGTKQNQEGWGEYMETKNEIVAHKLGETAYKYAVSIVKTILCIVISILFFYVFKFEWIPGALVVFIMIVTGLRFGWLQWHGEADAVMKLS